MFEHKHNHISPNAQLSNVASVDAIHTINTKNSFLGTQYLFFFGFVINFKNSKLILMQELRELSFYEL
jgi:hypothetical protein